MKGGVNLQQNGNPYMEKGKRGRPRARWRDELVSQTRTTAWMRHTRDRNSWHKLGEAFAQQWGRYGLMMMMMTAGHRRRNETVGRSNVAQNAAARMLTRTRKFDHISPILKQLHWLPIRQRIQFKLLLLTWKSTSCYGINVYKRTSFCIIFPNAL